MSFENITGHEKQKELFEYAIDAGRLSHAYLFEGPRGVGKTTFALALARRLSCEGDGTYSCECRNCRRIRGGNHPGVMVLTPPKEKQKFVVEIIDDLVHEFNQKSIEAGWKVAIFNNAEKMNASAANKLLKTLEEPPDRSMLILECLNAGSVIETLVSRCQRIRFAPLARERVEKYLIENSSADAEDAKTAAALSGGSVGRALDFIGSGMLEKKNEFLDVLISVDEGSIHDNAEHLSGMLEGGTSVERRRAANEFMDLVQLYFRDALAASARPGCPVYHVDRSELREGRFPPERAEGMVYAVDRARRLFEENVNMKQVMLQLLRDYLEVPIGTR